ncbi:MAG: ABC transporter ATP-binding protein [Myxococcaceae bacterium]
MSPLKRLLSYADSERPKIIKATIFSILNKFFDILPEVLIGVAVDTVIKRQDSLIAHLGIKNLEHQLIALGILTLVIWGFESLFDYLNQVAWRDLAQSLQHRLRQDTFKHVQKLPMSYFEDKNTGSLLSILNDDINQLERFLNQGADSIIQTIVSTLFVGVIFMYLAPQVAILALLPIPLILVGAYYFQSKLGPKYAAVREQASLISAHLNTTISGMAVVKSYTAEDFELQNLERNSRGYQQTNQSAIRLSSAYIPLIRMAIVLGFVATLVVGGHLALTGQLAVGAYSVLVFLTQRLLWPFTRLAEMTDLYERAMASVKRALDLLALPISHSVQHSESQVKAHTNSLSFDHVSLVYPNGFVALQDLNLEIPAGQTLALVGATGAGKSTITKLLLRFYEPSSGVISLGGQPLSQISLKNLRQSIGLVSQDVFLFHGSIRENIAYGSFEASQEQIQKAAQMAEAHEFIMSLPQGYETLIGERGQKLSGGQRQRISIARAILKDPPVFLFDEATSAVDNETESAIQKSINLIAKDRTTILIAHRLSTIRHAHRIVVLDAGRVVQSGTHDELVAQVGVYQKLWRIQTGEQ